MSGISCFPVSVQTQNDFSGPQYRSVELELIGDVLTGIANITGKIVNLFATGPVARTMTLSEQEKIDLARNPRTSQTILASLSLESSSAVRSEVALNQSSPDFVLRRLSSDADRFIASQARTRLAA